MFDQLSSFKVKSYLKIMPIIHLSRHKSPLIQTVTHSLILWHWQFWKDEQFALYNFSIIIYLIASL